MKNEKQTIGNTAKLLKVTPATVRNWVKAFSSFLSEDATRTTRKRFSAEDVATLQKVKTLLEQGSTYEKVSERLPSTPEIVDEHAQEPPETEEPETQSSGELMTIEYIEFLQSLLEQQHETHLETVQAKNQLIDELKNDKERLQTEVDHLKTPWFIRLFRKG